MPNRVGEKRRKRRKKRVISTKKKKKKTKNSPGGLGGKNGELIQMKLSLIVLI